MKIMARIVVIFTTIITASACSGSGNSLKADKFSIKDMCIVKTDNTTKICYGDSRPDVEKMLGTGRKDTIGVAYDFGVSVMYRSEKIAGIFLEKDSKGVYKTARGAEIGMLKNELKKLYGEKYALNEPESNLDYFYDSKANKYLVKVFSDLKRSPEEMAQTYMFSVMFDSHGSANKVMLLDQEMAVYFH